MNATVTPKMLATMNDAEVLAVIAQHRDIVGDPTALNADLKREAALPRNWPDDACYTDADVLAAIRDLDRLDEYDADADGLRRALQHAHNDALGWASLRLYRERVAQVQARKAMRDRTPRIGDIVTGLHTE